LSPPFTMWERSVFLISEMCATRNFGGQGDA
jgi:hypothetical protein